MNLVDDDGDDDEMTTMMTTIITITMAMSSFLYYCTVHQVQG
jgi:hypothetical protein